MWKVIFYLSWQIQNKLISRKAAELVLPHITAQQMICKNVVIYFFQTSFTFFYSVPKFHLYFTCLDKNRTNSFHEKYRATVFASDNKRIVEIRNISHHLLVLTTFKSCSPFFFCITRVLFWRHSTQVFYQASKQWMNEMYWVVDILLLNFKTEKHTKAQTYMHNQHT